MQVAVVELHQLRESPLDLLIGYPKPEPRLVEKRLSELKSLGVEKIYLTGDKKVGEIPVLGKGCVGVVVKATIKGFSAALKVRRVDADRKSMEHEAEMLRTANSLGIGPRLIAHSGNFLLMEFVPGILISNWINDSEALEDARVEEALKELLMQCHKLDVHGLDHGELVNASKHVLISPPRVTILDFESASLNRRPKNLRGVCQYLFLGHRSHALKMPRPKQDRLISALRAYKMRCDISALNRVLQAADLEPLQ